MPWSHDLTSRSTAFNDRLLALSAGQIVSSTFATYSGTVVLEETVPVHEGAPRAGRGPEA